MSDPFMDDALYLLKLYHRVVRCLVEYRDGSSGVALSSSFISVDRRFRDLSLLLPVDTVVEMLYPVFHVPADGSAANGMRRGGAATGGQPQLTQRDLALLRELLPVEGFAPPGADPYHQQQEGDGRVSPGAVLFALLQLIPQQGFLLDRIIRKTRGAMTGKTPSSLEATLRRAVTRTHLDVARPAVQGGVVMSFAIQEAGLTVSEAMLVAKFCSYPEEHREEGEDDSGEAAGDERFAMQNAALDPVKVLNVLFCREGIDPEIGFTLLSAQFAEATAINILCPAAGRRSGVLFLLEALQSLLPRDEENVEASQLSMAQFQILCERMGVPHIAAPLFSTLHLPPNHSISFPHLPVSALFKLYYSAFPCLGPSMWELTRCAAQQAVKAQHQPMAFLHLFFHFNHTDSIPAVPFIEALRQACGEGTLTDMDIESLRCGSLHRIQLLRLLTAPVPPARQAVIHKLQRFLVDGTHAPEPPSGDTHLSALHVYNQFDPSKVQGSQPRSIATAWQPEILRYFTELIHDEGSTDTSIHPEDIVTCNDCGLLFILLSAGVEDDPTFTMLIWQGFGMADKTRLKPRN